MLCLNDERISFSAITVAARASPLSQAQVKEVLAHIKQEHPIVDFVPHYIATTGDLDQLTSLRNLEKTDFFTREVDALVLNGQCRIGIHSAKDLPSPIARGLVVICLTQSIDSSDSLVLREDCALDTLSRNAIIATSSVRREQMVRELRPDARFIDLRGTIHQRLAKLESGEPDGVVIAEAALIRLGLTHLNRVKLPGDGSDGQGQLAVLAREGDEEMRELFACMDVRSAIKSVD